MRLFDGGKKGVKDSLVIDFDIRLRRFAYGDIFKLVFTGRDGYQSVIKMLYDNASVLNESRFSAVLESRKVIASETLPSGDISETWVHFHTKMDLVSDSLYVWVNDGLLTKGEVSFRPKMDVSITFGRSEFQLDVPSMSIRNLKLQLGRKTYIYNLDEDSGRYAYCRKHPFARASVHNPYWLNNDYKSWKKIFVNSSDRHQVVGYNSAGNYLYSLADGSFIISDLFGKTLDFPTYNSNLPVRPYMGSSVADPRTGELFLYEFYCPLGIVDTLPNLAVFNPDSLSWKILSKGFPFYPKLRNAVLVDTLTNSLIGYGGDGMFRYDGHIYTFHKGDSHWRELPEPEGGELWPRCMHSMGLDGRTLYIFGGVGSRNGEQILFQHLYNLHSINLDTYECRKLWEIPWSEEDKIPTETVPDMAFGRR